MELVGGSHGGRAQSRGQWKYVTGIKVGELQVGLRLDAMGVLFQSVGPDVRER